MENPDEGTVKLSDSIKSQAACPAKFEIKGLIGHGGMGMVFHAFDTELNREVAIKVLLYDGSRDSDSQKRFLREALVLASLDHPSIVKIYSSGLNDHGNPYHVMEYLQGCSLMQDLERGPLCSNTFLALFSQILPALELAHSNKIAHRDLKPSNVMHCTDESGGSQFKLIDFGIASIEMSPERSAKTLTRTNAILGSPFYISPEQCKGDRGDHLSDIYSLGCIMHECISGKRPFEGDTSFETMYKHMTETPPRLDADTSSKHSMRLAALVGKCLEKNPSNRPQSVLEIHNELNEIFSEGKETIDLFATKAIEPSTKLSGKSQLLLGSAIICLALVLIAWGGAQVLKPKSAQDILAASKAAKLNEMLEKSQATVARFEKELETSDSPALKQRLVGSLFDLARVQLQSKGTQKDAEKSYARAVSVCDSMGEKMLERKVASKLLLARAKWKQGKFSDANSEFVEARNLIDKLTCPKEMLIDYYFEKALMETNSRQFLEAASDFMIGDSRFTKLRSELDIDHVIDSVQPKTDKAGPSRSDLALKLALDLTEMKPGSPDEALKMLILSNRLAERLSKCPLRRKQDIDRILEYSVFLLPHVQENDELKTETSKLALAHKTSKCKGFNFSNQVMAKQLASIDDEATQWAYRQKK